MSIISIYLLNLNKINVGLFFHQRLYFHQFNNYSILFSRALGRKSGPQNPTILP